jgi:hypothetical protein
MIKCHACGRVNQENSQYCDECGARLKENPRKSTVQIETPKFQTLLSDPAFFQSAGVTSMEIPQPVENLSIKENSSEKNGNSSAGTSRAKLVIERGNAAGSEFLLTSNESYLGRWDADNGIFPDVDLDKYDSDAKISRKHARIIFTNGKYSIEDLGSTNGTFINRGRRLIPGIAQILNNGDEIIVGKTFLRFYIEE